MEISLTLILLMAVALVVSVAGLSLIFGGVDQKAASFAVPSLKVADEYLGEQSTLDDSI